MDNTRAEIDRLSNLATDWGGKLDEWRELTGFSCPSACAAELARLRAALAAPAPLPGAIPVPPELRELLLCEFGTTDPDLIRAALADRRAAAPAPEAGTVEFADIDRVAIMLRDEMNANWNAAQSAAVNILRVLDKISAKVVAEAVLNSPAPEAPAEAVKPIWEEFDEVTSQLPADELAKLRSAPEADAAEALEATLEDEEAAHQETLRLWQYAKSLLAEAREFVCWNPDSERRNNLLRRIEAVVK